MKVLHTISSMDLKSGGTTSCTNNLVREINDNNIKCEILTYSSKKSPAEDYIKEIDRPFENRFGYSKNFINQMINYKDFDVFHANGLWQFPSHTTAKFALRNNKPFVLSTHGMLYPNAMNKTKWFKKIAMAVYQRNDLNRANVIHATSLKELDNIRKLNIKTPVAVVPNGVVIKPLKKVKQEREKVGFLGRLDPIKNLESLIEAWALLGNIVVNKELLIIGDGDENYVPKLKQLASMLNCKNIFFKPFVSGQEKDHLINSLSVLILPSFSENFGMVVPEALSFKVPVIASKGSPWSDLEKNNCGSWIDNDKESISKELIKFFIKDAKSRAQMGENAFNYVNENFSIESVAKKIIQIYNWQLNKISKPDFIYDK